MDSINIFDLKADCVIGTRPEERQRRQTIALDLTLECDLAAAGHSDDLSDTIDYAAIEEAVFQLVAASQCRLLESLAQQVADLLLADPRVFGCSVRITKCGSLRHAPGVVVVINRRRE